MKRSLVLRSHAGARNPILSRAGLSTCLVLMLHIPVVTALYKHIGNLSMDRSESLQMTRRLEALHYHLPHSGRLVGILCPIVQAFVGPVVARE